MFPIRQHFYRGKDQLFHPTRRYFSEYSETSWKKKLTPKYYQSFELYFDSWEEFEVAKHSAERAEAVVDAKKLEAMFVGEIYHVVYEVNDFS